MEYYKNIPVVQARSRKAWRKWLQEHHASETSVWLIVQRKGSAVSGVNYVEAVEEALCFGWIDSKANTRDDESYYQTFAKRNPRSKWSNLNKERVARLSNDGLMTPAGQEMIDLAKSTGTWDALKKIQQLIIPDDLKAAFRGKRVAKTNFDAFPPSSKRIILEWIDNAKRPETRKKRIEQTVFLAEQNIRANHYRQ